MWRQVVLVCAAALAVAACEGGDGSPSGPPVITFLTPAMLDAVAFRDGDGAWEPRDPTRTSHQLEVRSGGRFGLAFVCRAGGLGEVIQAHAEEVSMLRVPCGDPLAGYPLQGPPQRWQGAIRGAPPGAQVTVTFGTHGMPVPTAVTGASYRVDLRAGSYDLVATAQPPDGPGRIIIKHAVPVAGPGTLDLDFETGALAARDRALTLPAGTPGERMDTAVIITTGRGARGALIAPTPAQVPVLDQALLGTGDTQAIVLTAISGDGMQLRGSTGTVGDGALPALPLPDPVAGASATLAAVTPVTRPRVTFQRQPGPLFYQLEIAEATAAEAMVWVVNTSARWLGDGATLELPDLSAVPGFTPNHGPTAGVPLLLQLTAVTSNRRLDVLLDGVAPPSRGERTSYAKTFPALPTP